MGSVLISCAKGDQEFAKALAQQISDAGFAVRQDVPDGAWSHALDATIHEADALLAIVSSEAVASDDVMYRWMFALGSKARVILVIREPVALHPRLAQLATLDFSKVEALPWGRLIGQLRSVTEDRAVPSEPRRAARPPSSGAASLLARMGMRTMPPYEQVEDDPALTLNDLISDLDGVDRDTRITAALRLGERGDPHGVQPLVKLLREEDWRVREAAIRALGRLRAASATVALLSVVQTDQPGPGSPNNDSVLEALCAIGEGAVPVLADVLTDGDSQLRLFAAIALGRIGAVDAIPALTAALRDTDWHVRWRAAEALGGLGDSVVLPDLVERLTDKQSEVRVITAWALGQLGSAEAIPHLLDRLQDAEWRVRWAAGEALWTLGADAIPGLMVRLHDPDSSVRRVAIRALTEIGTAAIEPLVATLSSENWDVRWAASEVLCAIGPEAVGPLVDALREGNWQASWAAAEILKRIGTAPALEAVAQWREGPGE